MRKIFAAILSVFILSVSLMIPAFAESKIEIKNQPQNATFPETQWQVGALRQRVKGSATNGL